LAIYGTAVELGMEKLEVLRLMSDVSGRFQFIVQQQILPQSLIMHTPDALDNVLKTINDIRTKRTTNSLWVAVEIEITKTSRRELQRI
jgi:UDP-N-acetylmuramoyl-L-alanyl-D-glutamate--2,6-diaminopimelate ligase